MKNVQIYYILSIGSIVLTFTTGIGVFASLILLVLIQHEKHELSNIFLVDIENELEILRKARKLNIINLIINGVIVALGLIVVIVLLFCLPEGRYFGA